MQSNNKSFNKVYTGQNTLQKESFYFKMWKFILNIKSKEQGHKIDELRLNRFLKCHQSFQEFVKNNGRMYDNEENSLLIIRVVRE